MKELELETEIGLGQMNEVELLIVGNVLRNRV